MRYISISRFASSLTFLGAAVAASASQFLLTTHQSLKIPQRWPWSMDQIDMIMTTIITLRYHFKICHAYINFVPFWAQCHSFDVASKPDNFAKMTNGSDQCGLEHDDNLSLDSKDYQKELSCVDVGNVGLQICSYIYLQSNFNSFDGTSKPENSKFLKLKQNWILLLRGMASI